MRTIIALLAAAALAGGAWLFATRVEIRGLDDVRLAPRNSTRTPAAEIAGSQPLAPAVERLRIATIDLSRFDEAKTANRNVLERLARIVREFDVVAIEGINSASDAPLARLVTAASAKGRDYQFLLSPARRDPDADERFAFVFNIETVEVDHTESYIVNDPHNRLRYDPFVAWFRSRGVPADSAFTFTLVAVRAAPDRSTEELNALADVFVRVRSDGRGEDDVILLGNFSADDHNLGRLGDLPRIACAVSGTPTNTRADRQLANLVFDHRATSEFTGRVGVFDFLREFNLSLSDALETSEHLPVWAEFSRYEGGRGS